MKKGIKMTRRRKKTREGKKRLTMGDERVRKDIR